MYLSGGFKVDENTGNRGYSNEVWKSSDGENWTLVSEGQWTARMNHGMVATDDALYIFGSQLMVE